MPATYKYKFMPKNRERALEAALHEFSDCQKQAKKLQHEMQGLNKRLELTGALLGFATGSGLPDGELRNQVLAATGEKWP